jgi:serine/threonine-protein kinase
MRDDRSLGSQKTVFGDSAEAHSIGETQTLSDGAAAVLGRIDRYELVRELGGGGFGVVYLAKDTVAGVWVAVKGLPPIVRNNAEELERIRENFALVSKLHHPNIAAALHLHPAKEVSYADDRVRQALRVLPGDTLMVMAYAQGVTLNRWRKQFSEGRVPVGQALEVCRQIAEALDYAHSERVVHRDVKPSNVMVETRESGVGSRESDGDARHPTLDVRVVVRVLDFGLAAEIRSSMSRVSQEKGDTSGTRPYMAPEQWAGKKQDGRTDQYALAALFYELVSGGVPFASAFDTGDPVIMANAAENKVPEPLAELTRAENEALLRALAKEPGERFAGCGELVAALCGGRSHAKTLRPKGKRAFLWLAGFAALSLLALAYRRSFQSTAADRASENAAVLESVAQAAAEEGTRRAEPARVSAPVAVQRENGADARMAADGSPAVALRPPAEAPAPVAGPVPVFVPAPVSPPEAGIASRKPVSQDLVPRDKSERSNWRCGRLPDGQICIIVIGPAPGVVSGMGRVIQNAADCYRQWANGQGMAISDKQAYDAMKKLVPEIRPVAERGDDSVRQYVFIIPK